MHGFADGADLGQGRDRLEREDVHLGRVLILVLLPLAQEEVLQPLQVPRREVHLCFTVLAVAGCRRCRWVGRADLLERERARLACSGRARRSSVLCGTLGRSERGRVRSGVFLTGLEGRTVRSEREGDSRLSRRRRRGGLARLGCDGEGGGHGFESGRDGIRGRSRVCRVCCGQEQRQSRLVAVFSRISRAGQFPRRMDA